MNQATQKTNLGFWLYLMTDVMLFAALFATFMILRGATNGGPDESELISLPFVLIETVVLLASSVVCGFAFVGSKFARKHLVIAGLLLTAALGATFLVMELSEFHALVAEGHTWQQSASLSVYFTLVGTHGAHIFIGLIWVTALMVYVLRRGLDKHAVRKIGLFTLFWHFLDLVWIFIFTIVYLLGVI